MKKLLTFLLALSMLLSAFLIGCADTEEETAGSESSSAEGSEQKTEGTPDSESVSGGTSGEEETKAPEFDYEAFDFKPYVTLAESEYIGKEISIPYDASMPESYYEKQLDAFLSQYATKIQVTDTAAKDGDTVNIYYKGVTVSEDGTETAFDSGTYQEFGQPYALTLGSGQFIEGFEEGLVGVLPTDTLRVRKTGTITDTDIALVTCKYTSKSISTGKESTSTDENIYFDFRGDVLLTELKNALLGKEVGGTYSLTTERDADKDGKPESENTYVVTVHGLLDLSTPATVSATFPNPYPNSPELAGKTVKFYVWMESIDGWELPELNATFVSETLKFKTEEPDVLAAFEREFREDVREAYVSECRTAVINAVSDHIREVIVFSSLPEAALDYEYASIKEEAEYYYNYYKKQGYKFSAIEDFIIAYYGVKDAGDSFKADAWYTERAEELTRENAIYFYLCDVLAVTVSESEVTDAVNAFLDQMIESAQQSENKVYTREEIYQKCVSYYGEGYIETFYRDSIRENRLNDRLYENLTVIYAGEGAE